MLLFLKYDHSYLYWPLIIHSILTVEICAFNSLASSDYTEDLQLVSLEQCVLPRVYSPIVNQYSLMNNQKHTNYT